MGAGELSDSMRKISPNWVGLATMVNRVELIKMGSINEDSLLELAWSEARAKRPNLSNEKLEKFAKRNLDRLKKQLVSIREEGPILEDLSDRAGLVVETLGEITREDVLNHPSAIDVLLFYLDKSFSPLTLCTFIPKLEYANTNRARVASALLDLFARPGLNEDVRERIGFTVKTMLDESHVNRMAELIKTEALGPSRVTLVNEFAELAKVEATSTLLEVIDEPLMLRETLIALGMTGDVQAIPYLERYLDHDESDVRKFARSSLKKLEKYR